MYMQLFGGGAKFKFYFCKLQLMMNGWMGGATTSSTAAAERWSANSQHRQSVSSSYYAQQQQQQQQQFQQQQQQTRWAEASSRQVRAVRAPLKYVCIIEVSIGLGFLYLSIYLHSISCRL